MASTVGDDAGENFRKLTSDAKLRQRAWYYTHVYADPKDANTVYVLNTGFYRSVDGGQSFPQQIQVPHGDNHDLWINPNDPDTMINANDGGANVSFNGGESWSWQMNQPTAEMYRVFVERAVALSCLRPPAGQQHDLGAQPRSGVVDADAARLVRRWWLRERPHCDRPARSQHRLRRLLWRLAQLVERRDRTGSRDHRLPPAPARTSTARPRVPFPVETPRFGSHPHDPDVLYHTSQVVHRSTDQGQSWQVISTDLSTNNLEQQDFTGGPITRDSTGVEVYKHHLRLRGVTPPAR